MDIKTVIIADMEASRKMAIIERHEYQLFLKSAIIQINELFADEIEASFMITKGDEFQGVLKDITSVHKLVRRFERLVFPFQV